MGQEEFINHNITLTFDFLREAVKDSSNLENLENESVIEFVEQGRVVPKSKIGAPSYKFFKVKHHFEKIDSDALSTKK